MNFFRNINLVFRKCYSAQHCLFAISQKCKEAVDNIQVFGTLLTDPSKDFDCLPDEFLIAKSDAYGFSLKTLKLINNYLSQKNQKTKINEFYSSWQADFLWNPSRLAGRIYFVQHISQWFFSYFEWYWHWHSYIYADDNSLYKACDNVVKNLRISAKKLFKWFKHNQMQENAYKCHLILLVLLTGDSYQIQIENSLTKSSLSEKLLYFRFDHQFTFDQLVKGLCKKVNEKLKAFTRPVWYVGLAKKKLTIHSRFKNNRVKN